MHLAYSLRAAVVSAACAGLFLAGTVHATPQVWSGRTYTFTKTALSNPALPANQDRITPIVWITRANTAGIYNIAQEAASGGQSGFSPLDTEWATGDAVNYASLTFDTWVNWAGANPPGTIGVNAVVHLISEDIYIDIRFDSWGVGFYGQGGAFSYTRAVQPAATPARPSTWGMIKALYR
jgi:hypothetical protein